MTVMGLVDDHLPEKESATFCAGCLASSIFVLNVKSDPWRPLKVSASIPGMDPTPRLKVCKPAQSRRAIRV